MKTNNFIYGVYIHEISWSDIGYILNKDVNIGQQRSKYVNKRLLNRIEATLNRIMLIIEHLFGQYIVFARIKWQLDFLAIHENTT